MWEGGEREAGAEGGGEERGESKTQPRQPTLRQHRAALHRARSMQRCEEDLQCKLLDLRARRRAIVGDVVDAAAAGAAHRREHHLRHVRHVDPRHKLARACLCCSTRRAAAPERVDHRAPCFKHVSRGHRIAHVQVEYGVCLGRRFRST